jgi:hypothetical protein
MELKPRWEFVADTVMGGVSKGSICTEIVAGRKATRLTGAVSLENNGGFVQMAFDINEDGSTFDASGFNAVELDIFGNEEAYDLRLRTSELTRPWHSYRASFFAPTEWTTILFPLSDFNAHKTEVSFNRSLLRRIGVLAIGRVFNADISVAGVRLIG